MLTPADRPPWLPQAVWPWPTGMLATRSGPIAVTDVGTGPALLLVHVGMWSLVWRDLMRELVPTFRCITLDAPGNGRSHRPGPAGTTLSAAADAVTDVIEQLDLQDLTLVVHDLGGPAALAAAARTPRRVNGIVAVNTFAWRPDRAALRGMLAVAGSAPLRASDAVTGWLPAATSTRLGVGRCWNRADKAAFRAGFDREARRSIHRYLDDARLAVQCYDDVHAALTGPLEDRPVLTVFGQYNDPFGFQPRWRSLFPSARQEVVPRGNHFPMCDAPQLVADWIRTWHTAEVTGRHAGDSAGRHD